MRKTTLKFIIIISALMFYTGCGEDENGTTPPPPGAGGGASCAESRAAFEATLPVPEPSPGRYVVQLVNESNVMLLAAANSAHRVNEPPKSVLPREGTWAIEPGGVLTVDIPEEWERTIPLGSLGPVFWARSGCRFDIEHNFAQCETGDCGGVYDCSKAGRTPPGAKSLAEWTFDDTNHNAAPDISVVDGVNINMDIVPVGPHSDTAGPGVNPGNWLGSANLPLSKCRGDLRAECPAEFQLRRKQLSFFIKGAEGAEDVVACFSNCGQYKFQGALTGACPPEFRCPGEPPQDCMPDLNTDIGRVCHNWLAFCTVVPIGDPNNYNRPCNSDADCIQSAGCWQRPGVQSVCAGRAFNKNPDCPPDVCTLPFSENPTFQPPFGLCSDVTDRPEECIGDDTFHEVMPRGLTWPNDPQTYFSDARAYRVVFAPGGTDVPITESGPIPLCSTLPVEYRQDEQRANCRDVINNDGALFAGARPSPSCSQASDCAVGGCNPMTHHCDSWECEVADGSSTNAVLCRW
jgi:Thaumatin family